MRADMHKVFSKARHRRGQLWSKVKQKGTARARARMLDEEQPYTERMRPRKGFSSRRQKYDVLRRWVRAQVGRLWSEVYSEICQQLDTRTEVQREARKRLGWYVEQNVVLVNGQPYDSLKRYRVQDVWVHPDTGILMPAPKVQPWTPNAEQRAYIEREKRRNQPKHKIDHTHRLVWLEDYGDNPGRWYVVTLKPLPETEPTDYENYPRDVLDGSITSDYQWFRAHQFRIWGDYVYAAEKRPAKNKTVRRYTTARDNQQTDVRVTLRSPGTLK